MEWTTTRNLENVRVAFMPPPWPESSSFNSLHSSNYDPYSGIYAHIYRSFDYIDALVSV